MSNLKQIINKDTILNVEYHHQSFTGILVDLNKLDYKIKLTKGKFVAGTIKFDVGDVLTIPKEFAKVT